MQCKWLGDRVPAPNLAQAIHSVVSREEDESWGPNTKFKFPTHNGTGNIWRAFADLIPESKKIFGKEAEVTKINLDSQVAHLANGSCIKYGQMISTMPLTTLGNIASDKELQGHTNRLRYSSTHIVGIGLRGQPPKRFLKTYWVRSS